MTSTTTLVCFDVKENFYNPLKTPSALPLSGILRSSSSQFSRLNLADNACQELRSNKVIKFLHNKDILYRKERESKLKTKYKGMNKNFKLQQQKVLWVFIADASDFYYNYGNLFLNNCNPICLTIF